MIGRQEEMKMLRQLQGSGRFEFLVMYGRRRVGKTTILQEFSREADTIYYSAQEKNDALNLLDFSKLLQNHFDHTFIASFPGWEEAFSYLTQKMGDRRTVLIIDEFPFIAKQNPSIKSMLQHMIDHAWKESGLFLILCGSSVSFMINDVMGYESPLYGRCTGTMEVMPFDYLESADFFPAYSYEDKLLAYGILGGIPRYLQEFSDQKSIQENIRDRILASGSFLADEPEIMLRMELRETSVYSSILEAVASGYNKVKNISEHIHEEQAKVSKYLKTLTTLRIVDRISPCGEPEDGKKAVYELIDPYFRFWYRYIFANRSYYDLLGTEEASEEIMESLNDYMGEQFEKICMQFLRREAKARKLPFVPQRIGRWWGTNPSLKAQDDVDILALSRRRNKALLCECKFRNRPMPMEEYDDLMAAAGAFPDIKEKYYLFISKSGFTQPVRERALRENVSLYTEEDLFTKKK